MKTLTLLVTIGFLSISGVAQALTVDEIVRLKQAGVSDSTIELLIRGDGDSRSAGTWKTKDGWRVTRRKRASGKVTRMIATTATNIRSRCIRTPSFVENEKGHDMQCPYDSL